MYIIFILFCVIFADQDHVIIQNLYNYIPMYIIFVLFHVIYIVLLYIYEGTLVLQLYEPSLALCLPLAILKPLEECARAQSGLWN